MADRFILDYEVLGEKFKQKRHSLGLSQEAAAEKSNLSIGFYGNLERGSKVLSVESLIKVANALSLDLNNLFMDSETIADTEKLQADLNYIFTGKTPSATGYLISLLKLLSDNMDKLQQSWSFR
jgi:transcriptional regulator with XRE-family HTH domain